MNRSIIVSSVLHLILIMITAMSLPFLAKKPIDLPPIVSVELIQITDKTNIPFAPKAKKTIDDLNKWISNNEIICEDKSDEGWGLYGKPHSLNYATSSESALYSLFTKETIESDLKEMINRQKEDGRWDTWYGISEGTKLEWDGIQTLWVLKVLKNYGRIEK